MKETYLGRNRSCRCERTSATLGRLFQQSQEYSLVSWSHASHPRLKVSVLHFSHSPRLLCLSGASFSPEGMAGMRNTHRTRTLLFALPEPGQTGAKNSPFAMLTSTWILEIAAELQHFIYLSSEGELVFCGPGQEILHFHTPQADF